MTAFSEGETENDYACHVQHYYDDYFKTSIVCRRDWGARSAKNDMVQDRIKNKFAIHHSAGSAAGNAESVREIQRMHMDDNGWSDCGYHFFVARNGTCYEGRELKFQGAHVEGNNKGNIGICFLGCFDSNQDNFVEPTSQMIEKAGELIGILADRFSIDCSNKTIKGHKEHSNAGTLCPGDRVLALKDKIILKAIRTKKEIAP